MEIAEEGRASSLLEIGRKLLGNVNGNLYSPHTQPLELRP